MLINHTFPYQRRCVHKENPVKKEPLFSTDSTGFSKNRKNLFFLPIFSPAFPPLYSSLTDLACEHSDLIEKLTIFTHFFSNLINRVHDSSVILATKSTSDCRIG